MGSGLVRLIFAGPRHRELDEHRRERGKKQHQQRRFPPPSRSSRSMPPKIIPHLADLRQVGDGAGDGGSD